MSDFDYWLKLYNANDLLEFSTNTQGLLWLKLKSIVRKKWLEAFIVDSGIAVRTKTLDSQWMELYDALRAKPDAHMLLDKFIIAENRKIAASLPVQQLVSELYKMRSFDWGGNYQNNLDRYIVDKFIKTIHSFDEISLKIQNEIATSVAGYVLCSWYNHWSSILIEHLFKEHPKVLPTLGMIKKVDFFVDQVPFDLKVTYLPEGFISEQRTKMGLKSEISELRSYARSYGINYDKNAEISCQAYEISQKLSDAGHSEKSAISKTRKTILNEALANPKILIKWLYENQGERRFDASNRIFLIVVDPSGLDSSWKLKRSLDLLKPSIHKWADNFKKENLPKIKLDFCFDGKFYTSYSDAIFIVKTETI